MHEIAILLPVYWSSGEMSAFYNGGAKMRPSFVRSLKALDKALIVITASVLLLYLGKIAAREYTFLGGIAIFMFLASFTLAVVSSTRYAVTTMVLIGLIFKGIDGADVLKTGQIAQHVQFIDIFGLTGVGLSGGISLVAQYATAFKSQLYFAATGAIIVFIILLFEVASIQRWRTVTLPRGSFLILALLALTNGTIFWNSSYLRAVGSQNLYSLISNTGSLRYSYLIAGARDYANSWVKFSFETKSSGARASAEPLPECRDCPDIVIVHVESTFDPNILREYEDTPGLMDRLDRKHSGKNGYLLVNTWGGFSWISEFEILCGVNHDVFGQSGAYPPITLAPFVTSCMPEHLKSLGYDTFAIYSANGAWLNIRNAFKRYGIDTMYDTKDLNVSSVVAYAIPDRVFTDKLLEILERPRVHPRFIWVSTNWNHAPHGLDWMSYKEASDGPFSLAPAKSRELRDYINRLNDTYTNLERLEQKIGQMRFPITMLQYGDHQPAFTLNFRDKIPHPKLILTTFKIQRPSRQSCRGCLN
jgi:phosphoglycerol transferase MdoB-like AlkP superfamily enzyme